MKKILLIACAAIFTIALALNVNLNKDNDLSPVSLASLEALADGPTGDVGTGVDGPTFGNTVDCYSSTSKDEDKTCYDCGFCIKQIGYVGEGNIRTCVAQR